MQTAMAAIDRTPSCLPCTSREGSPIAWGSAMPPRDVIAAERSVASRRLSAVTVSTVPLPLVVVGVRTRRLDALRLDVPAEHHVVVLVREVVAVRDVGPGERPELALDDDFLARVQR